jgi:RHS repeat-associated protein
VAVVHDLDGNMTSGPLNSNAAVAHGFDARNRLISVAASGSAPALSYAYDPAGHRVAVTQSGQTTTFAVNPVAALSQVLVRTRPNGAKTFYVYGPGLLYQVDDAENTVTYHYDTRGSTIALTGGAGTVTDRVEYSTYGRITHREGTTDTPFLFNGRYGVMTDPNGLYLMRARYYNPHLRRFVNADPIGLAGGMNFYAYADGNPISLIDPFGLAAVGESGLGYWLKGLAKGVIVDGLWGDIKGVGAALSDLPGTAAGLWHAATHPLETADAIWTGLKGFGQNVASGDPRAVGAGVYYAAGVLIPVTKIRIIDQFGDAGRIAEAAKTVANPVPSTMARVIPEGIPATTLGRPGAADVFVTAADDIAGMNAVQIANRLGIPQSPTGFRVFEFPTPQSGVASPVFRSDPGFIGGGLTSGGAREFVIPNGPIPPGAVTRTVP